MVSPRIAPARLRWHDDQPFSDDFGDIYHAPDGAAEVARVFLAPSAFSERIGRSAQFRIGELGFGSGLNLVVAAEASVAAGRTLHFVSFESAPIAPSDFAQLAARRARSHPLYVELARVYPPLIRGWHQRHLAGGRIHVSVFWGDANAGVTELADVQRQPFDAWFLDGFAPDRNPELWNDVLFGHLARLSTQGTTVATFTAAGRVRRSLEQAGFTMRRIDQRPHKRESLAGTFVARGREPYAIPRKAIVIGAGLAGASAARHLAEAGITVTVYDPHPPVALRSDLPTCVPEPAGSPELTGCPEPIDTAGSRDARHLLPGSAIPTTVLHGRLLADAGAAGTLRCHAFLYAAAWASRFAGFTRTGVLQLPATGSEGGPSAEPAPERMARLAAIAATWGTSGPWLEQVSQATAVALTGWPVASGGLWFADGGIVATPRFCAALLEHPAIEVVAAAGALPDGPPTDGVPIVLACGIEILAADPGRYLELAQVYGQLDFVNLDPLPCAPIVGNGYLAPGHGLLAAGATYEYRAWDPEAATNSNLAQLAGRPFSWEFRSRGTRTVASDRNAVAGPLYTADGESLAPFYVTTGHGSMGNVSSHFAAALITASICGDAPPMAPQLAQLLTPLRFRERQRRRGLRHGARD